MCSSQNTSPRVVGTEVVGGSMRLLSWRVWGVRQSSQPSMVSASEATEGTRTCVYQSPLPGFPHKKHEQRSIQGVNKRLTASNVFMKPGLSRLTLRKIVVAICERLRICKLCLLWVLKCMHVCMHMYIYIYVCRYSYAHMSWPYFGLFGALGLLRALKKVFPGLYVSLSAVQTLL